MKTFGVVYLVIPALLGVMATLAAPGYEVLVLLPFAALGLALWAFKRRPSKIVLTVAFLANLAIALAMRFWFYIPNTNRFNETGTALGMVALALPVVVCFVVYALEREAGSFGHSDIGD